MRSLPLNIKVLVNQAITLIERQHLVIPAADTSPASRWQAVGPDEMPKDCCLKPNRNGDLAVRIALALAIKTKDRVGYWSLSECTVHAVLRMMTVVVGVDPQHISRGELLESDFPKLTRSAGQIAGSSLIFTDQELPSGNLTKFVRSFTDTFKLDALVIDDPDVATLAAPESAPGRIRMEFREAVRGSKVRLILPG